MTSIDDTQRAYAASLAHELERSHHRVALLPAPRPMHAEHKIRVAVELLPDWYRQLLSTRPSRRRDRRRHWQTAIKRQHTINGLRAIAAGREGCYASLPLPIIDHLIAEDRAAEIYAEAQA